MLDAFEILTTSGVVVWSKTYAPVGNNVINSLINDVFIEERGSSIAKSGDDGQAARNAPFKKDKYTLKYTTAKDLGLIFVAVYQSILHLSWVDNLLDVTRALFIKQFAKDVKKANTSRIDCSPFGQTFDALVAKLDKTSTEPIARSDQDSTDATELTPPSSSAGTEDGMDEPPPPPVPGLKKRIVLSFVSPKPDYPANKIISCLQAHLQRHHLDRCHSNSHPRHLQTRIPRRKPHPHGKGWTRRQRFEKVSQARKCHFRPDFFRRGVTRQKTRRSKEGKHKVQAQMGYRRLWCR